METETNIKFNPELTEFSKEELAYVIPEPAKRKLGEVAINE